jgi:2-polyprenyl-3-methyl-5-hydroxy-6-metoxy-1,4-benzoquinol methylase
MLMDEYMNTNKELWDKLAKIHHDSEFYDVKGFLEGKQTLDPIEVDELPDLKGKTLIHLMCHFGMDTLSLARMGATVTGIDFSSEAIDLAISLAKTAGINAKFVCSNVYDVRKVLKETFDFVFTSAGVLTWLPDLKAWAKVIADSLNPGGTFYIRDFHPYSYIFDDENAEDLQVKYPYFQGKEPQMFEAEGSYADKDAKTGMMKTYEWNHPMSRIINSLINAGLRIEFFHEFDVTTYQALPFMIERDDGRYILPRNSDKVPLMFSIMATKN